MVYIYSGIYLYISRYIYNYNTGYIYIYFYIIARYIYNYSTTAVLNLVPVLVNRFIQVQRGPFLYFYRDPLYLGGIDNLAPHGRLNLVQLQLGTPRVNLLVFDFEILKIPRTVKKNSSDC